MNQFQENSLRRYNVMKVVLNQHSLVWNANPTFALAVSDFENSLTEINNLGMQQKNSTKGVTSTKLQARNEVIDQTMAVAAAAKAYAVSINDIVLLATCSMPRTKLLQARGVEVAALAQYMYDTVNPIAVNLSDYGANATTLASLQTAIDVLHTLLGAPRAQQANKVAATQMLETAFAQIRNIKNNRLTPLMLQYKNTSAVFYDGYLNSCAIANLGHRHKVAFAVSVFDANKNPVKDALVVLTGPKKRKKFTPASGCFKFTQLTPGTYNFTVTLTDGSVLHKTIMVDNPQMVVVEFSLS